MHFPTDAAAGYAAGASGTILKTTDSGLTLTTRISGTSLNFYGIRFSDSNSGYTVGQSGIHERSTDTGFNWFRQPSATAQDLLSVDFGSPTIGLAVGRSGTIVRTTNGGDPSVVLHPTQAGAFTGFTGLAGCSSKWDCVNDQTGNAPVGLPLSNDGVATNIFDNSGFTNRVVSCRRRGRARRTPQPEMKLPSFR